MENARIAQVEPGNANEDVKRIYQGIEHKMQMLPNIFKNMGNSTAVLKGYLGLNDAVGHTSLSPQLREKLALVIGQVNDCQYCLSAHTMSAKSVAIPDIDILNARKGIATNPKEAAILKFAKLVVEKKGHVTDQDVATLKAASVSDAEITEIIMIIIVNMFTNYFNIITGTKVDFPAAPPLN